MTPEPVADKDLEKQLDPKVGPASSSDHEKDPLADKLEKGVRSRQKRPGDDISTTHPEPSGSEEDAAVGTPQPSNRVSTNPRPPNTPGAFATAGVPAFFHAARRENSETHPTEDASNIHEGPSNLVQARPVDEEMPQCLEEAEPISEEDAQQQVGTTPAASKRWRGILSVGGIMLVLWIVVAVVLVAAGPWRKNGNKQTLSDPGMELASTPSSPYTAEELYLLGQLELLSPLLQPNQTMHSPAFQWLVQDPNLANYSNVQVMQRYALSSLYFATRGDLWTEREGWLSYSHHECEWFADSSFRIFGPLQEADSPCDEHGIYKRLWLQDNNLNGTIPDELYLGLSSLESINLYRNMALGGSISGHIGALSNLSMMNLGLTDLGGTIPSELGLCTSLELLYFSKLQSQPSSFQGSLPSELGQLTKLQQLTLFQNDMSSSLPTQIGLMTDLFFLGLLGNQFSGQLPSEIGTLRQLKLVYLYDNLFTGNLPTSLEHLTSLTNFHAHRNAFSGSIPSGLALIGSLKELILSENDLTGVVPPLSAMSDLNILYLSHNPGLEGTISLTDLANMSHLEALDINGTRIDIVLQDTTNDTTDASTTMTMGSVEQLMNCSYWKYYYDKIPCRSYQ